MENKILGTIEVELDEILQLDKVRPYVFRTRLERTIERAAQLKLYREDLRLKKEVDNIKQKLYYISDHSNQTSDGTLKSFVVLKDDLYSLKNLIHNLA